jgi:hypothetical protein
MREMLSTASTMLAPTESVEILQDDIEVYNFDL